MKARLKSELKWSTFVKSEADTAVLQQARLWRPEIRMDSLQRTVNSVCLGSEKGKFMLAITRKGTENTVVIIYGHGWNIGRSLDHHLKNESDGSEKNKQNCQRLDYLLQIVQPQSIWQSVICQTIGDECCLHALFAGPPGSSSWW